MWCRIQGLLSFRVPREGFYRSAFHVTCALSLSLHPYGTNFSDGCQGHLAQHGQSVQQQWYLGAIGSVMQPLPCRFVDATPAAPTQAAPTQAAVETPAGAPSIQDMLSQLSHQISELRSNEDKERQSLQDTMASVVHAVEERALNLRAECLQQGEDMWRVLVCCVARISGPKFTVHAQLQNLEKYPFTRLAPKCCMLVLDTLHFN